MSNYKVISQVGHMLRQVLWDAFEKDSEIDINSLQTITFKNPKETAAEATNRLSIWLYHITENEFVKNQPMLRRDDSSSQFPPLALNMYFLITPFGSSGESNLLLLGKIMEVFYDNAILFIEDPNYGLAEDLRITFHRTTLEELTKIWESLQEPYRLSVCYEVRVVHIDSKRRPDIERVVSRDANFEAG